MPEHKTRPASDDASAHPLAALRQWIGRSRLATDTVTETPVKLLAATLDREEPLGPGDELPCLWHWLYFLPATRYRDLGPDGHASRGDFMPPVILPGRMWAGSTLEFRMPLKVGDSITRRRVIGDVYEKSGRSGRLIFVRVRDEIECPRGLALIEERNIVFRDVQPSAAAEPRQAPDNPQWSKRIVPDSVLLFRYSALTFNSHRIHYDRAYATETEGYRNLVVTGPLVATLLAELATAHLPARRIERLSFRSISPLFADEPCEIAGRCNDRAVELWATNPDKGLSMTAQARVS